MFLVGAGPGDPELLTLKAVKAIGRADVLLVDDLVCDEVLQFAKADARVVQVGKRGGCQSTRRHAYVVVSKPVTSARATGHLCCEAWERPNRSNGAAH